LSNTADKQTDKLPKNKKKQTTKQP